MALPTSQILTIRALFLRTLLTFILAVADFNKETITFYRKNTQVVKTRNEDLFNFISLLFVCLFVCFFFGHLCTWHYNIIVFCSRGDLNLVLPCTLSNP